MKLIAAIIKPFKLDEVKEALSTLGIQGSANSGRDDVLLPESAIQRSSPDEAQSASLFAGISPLSRRRENCQLRKRWR